MTSLRAIEIKAFVPSRDFAVSKRFYQDLGFTMKSDAFGVAYMQLDEVSFLLQDFYVAELANNLMMHLQVEDVDAWWSKIRDTGLAATYGIKVTEVAEQPWRMRDFVLIDPAGVMWRIAQRI